MKPAAELPTIDTATLEAELEWLAQLIELRLRHYFHDTAPASPPLPGALLPPPALPEIGPYASALQVHHFDPTERLLMILALAPQLRPQLLDVLATSNPATQRPYTEFGSLPNPGGAMQPSVETACFLLAGEDLGQRLQVLHRLAPQQRLAQQDLLQVQVPASADSANSAGFLQGLLMASTRFLAEALPGPALPQPAERSGLATRVRTGLGWADLVLPTATLAQLDDIGLWLAHGPRLLNEWGFGRRVGAGHVSLFHGPPGTGKTLSACLLGERCGREVHRVDLSLVVSKYIGETEKNLSRLFDTAEREGWILFFDEADALFGKRTGVGDSHDRYANQEVSYLLQRIESFSGVVVLASNMKHNIDDAFLRRFQSVVHFPLPKAPERLRLWREGIPAAVTLAPALDLHRLAQAHELSGGTIVNVLRHACLRSLARGDALLRAEDVDEGVRRELLKEGRAL